MRLTNTTRWVGFASLRITTGRVGFACLAITSLLALTLVAAAVRAAPGDPRVLAIHPAQSPLAVSGKVAAFSPDMRSVLGFSLRGERLWRVPTGEHGGARDLRALGSNVLAYTGKEALSISAESGKVEGRRDLVLPDPAAPTDGCELISRGAGQATACALRCACSFELVRCDTLATIGPSVELKKLAPVGDSAEARCPAYSGALVGRTGDVVIASFPIASDTPFFGVAEEVVGVSHTSGEVLWRARDLGRFDPELSGVGGDDSTCFVGSRAGSLSVFDCQRATPRWRRKISIVKTIEPQILALPGGLLVRDGKKLLSLALTDGAPRWTIELPARTVAWPTTGGPRTAWPSKPETMALVSSDSGRVIASLPLPSGVLTSPLMTERLLVALGKEELGVYDRDGLPLATLRRKPGTLPLVGSGALLFVTPDRVELHHLGEGLALRSAYEGPLARARPVAIGDDTLVLHREGKRGWDPSDPETFGELHFLSVPR